jgi:host factor-I protein
MSPLLGRETLTGKDHKMGKEQQISKDQQGSDMEKNAQNIQETFLNNARKDKTFLTIYLMSGVKLSGRIKSFDKYSVVLETNNQEQLIFKHAISTVVVGKGDVREPRMDRGHDSRERPHTHPAAVNNDPSES